MRLPLCALGVAALLWAPVAHAGLQVLRELPDAQVTELRIVSGGSGAQTATWLSLEAAGPGSLLVIVPLAPGARVDLASGAWLDALELATAPRITPPAAGPLPSCGRQYDIETTARPSEGPLLVPKRHVLLPNGMELRQYASFAGFDADEVTPGSSASTSAFLLAVYELADAARFTQPIRIVTPGGADPLTLDGAPGVPVPVTHFDVAPTRLSLLGAEETTAHDLEVTWLAWNGESDFGAVRSNVLETAEEEPRSLVEHASSGVWLTPTRLPGGAEIAPLYATYLDRASTLGETELDPFACLARLEEVHSRGAEIGLACAPGALDVAPGASDSEPSCDVAAEEGVVPADVCRCGGADDIAYALSGLGSGAVLTRTRLLLEERPLKLELSASSAGEVASVVAADRLDPTCPSSGQGGTPSNDGSFTLGGSYGHGSYDPYPGAYHEEPVTEETGTEVDVALATADACSGSTEASGDSCSGSTRDDGYDGETCSGGSDTDSGYDGETCGGSEGGGESCDGGDSSGYSGETCSGGGSGSGYSGETCSGSSGSGSSCAVSRPRTRPRLSALAVLAACMLWPLRRAGRRAASRRR